MEMILTDYIVVLRLTCSQLQLIYHFLNLSDTFNSVNVQLFIFQM